MAEQASEASVFKKRIHAFESFRNAERLGPQCESGAHREQF